MTMSALLGDDLDAEHQCTLPVPHAAGDDVENVWSCSSCSTLWMWHPVPGNWATAAQ
jgi:hypothetical protein